MAISLFPQPKAFSRGRLKHSRWVESNEIHKADAVGPFVGKIVREQFFYHMPGA